MAKEPRTSSTFLVSAFQAVQPDASPFIHLQVIFYSYCTLSLSILCFYFVCFVCSYLVIRVIVPKIYDQSSLWAR